MAYNEQLKSRVRSMLKGQRRVEEKKMFGDMTFMVNGKICVGISKKDLMVCLDPAVHWRRSQAKGCREMNVTGKPMKGIVFFSPRGTSNEQDLSYWIDLALEVSMKAKVSKKRKKFALKPACLPADRKKYEHVQTS